MERYETYKDSGVEWIGEIPDGWKVKQIKRLSIVRRGASPRPIADPKYFDNEGEYAWVRIADVSASERYLENSTQTLSELGSSLSVKMQPDNIFLSIAGTVGKPIITKIKCCIHDGFVYFPNLKINPEYLYFIFSTGLPYQGLGKWGTQLNLNTDTVGEITIPLPTTNEITAIVSYLDSKTAEIDALIAQKQRLIELYQEEKAAIINQAVTQGIDPNAPLKDSGIDWLGEIPDGWEVLPLRRLTIFVKTGGTPSGAEEHHFEVEGYNWYSPGDFSEAVYLGLSKRSLSATGKEHVYIFPKMTVMMVGIGATIGKVGLSEMESSCNQQINAIGCNDKINPVFAAYYLKTMRDFIVKCGKFTTLPIINQDETKSLMVTVPSREEQTAIVQHIDTETARINAKIAKTKRIIELQKEYRTALISEVVTGKIKVSHLAVKEVTL